MLKSRESEILERSETLERSESGVGNFRKAGVGYFASDSATVNETIDWLLNTCPEF